MYKIYKLSDRKDSWEFVDESELTIEELKNSEWLYSVQIEHSDEDSGVTTIDAIIYKEE